MDIESLKGFVAEKNGCSPLDIEWFSWPQVFGSTAGPRRGAGGAAMTTFQVYAFKSPVGDDMMYCNGVWGQWDGQFMSEFKRF